MLTMERHLAILQLLKERGCATVGYLCKRLYVSAATIRRDLTEMESRGLLQRVRGGAVLPGGSGDDAPLLLRETEEPEKKNYIAGLAIRLLHDGATVFLDSSSTVSALARRLDSFQNLTILTSGIVTLNILNDTTSVQTISCGGVLQNHSTFSGPSALQTIQNFHADVFFFSCCGFSPCGGSTEAREDFAAVKRAMLRNSTTHVLLCDSTKFERDYLCRMCDIRDIHYLLTDQRPSFSIPQDWKGQLVY